RMHLNRGGCLLILMQMKELHWLMRLFDTSIFDDEEVVAKKEVSTANRVPIAGEVVTTASVEVSTAAITSQISMDEIIKYQIMIDEEVSKNLEAQMQAELEEKERLASQKEEEANIALIG
nr:hypothetical protein [Tanacetum cinerariifolium]